MSEEVWRPKAWVATVCWLVVGGLGVAVLAVFSRLRVDIADNRRTRRARTQVSLLRRLASVAVIVIGFSAVLISFPGLRTFGTSLLASAGVAGVVAGLAAQTTLGNVIAGLQLAFTDALRMDDVVVVEGSGATSRSSSSVILHLDYDNPVPELRHFVEGVVRASPLWDQRDRVLQVTDTTETTMVVSILASAHDGPSAWDLRCDIREAALNWLRDNHPQSLPTQRVAPAHGHQGEEFALENIVGAART